MPHTNPLLQTWVLPPYEAVRAEHLVPAINAIITDNRRLIEGIITTQSSQPTWDDLVLAVVETDARLDEAMGIVETLSMVKHKDPAWNTASIVCNDALAQYTAWKMNNRELFQAYQGLAQSPAAGSFDDARKAVLAKLLLRFRLSGIELPLEQQQKLSKLNLDIDLLAGLFLSNLESAHAAWSKHTEDPALLNGLSESTKDRLALTAQREGLNGWLIRLDQDTYRRVMTYAENRSLREECFIAYATRASDQGPHAGQFDNGPVLQVLLAMRQQKAQLLGYENFAQLSLTTEMAESTAQVSDFLNRQVALARPALEEDARVLAAFALERGNTDVQAWDQDFLIDQLRKKHLGSALEKVQAYFPLDATLQRLCLFSERMFGIQIVEQSTFERWHDTVRLFEISEHGQVVGYIYLDPFHREETADFAFTAARRNRRVNAEGQVMLPIVQLHSNFTGGTDLHPCLLGHRGLRVLFHEFGHCLQHVLSRSPHFTLSGINQLGRDSAEFTGQLFELWLQSREFVLWLAAHHQTGERLTEARIDVALTATQMQTSRQSAIVLMSAMVDFQLHLNQRDGRSAEQVIADVQSKMPQLRLPSYCRFANSFDYMVTGYAASVYAYKWSGVLATLAFKRFKQEWVFNPQTGRDLREAIFSPGDSRSLLASLEAFLGEPVREDLFAASTVVPQVNG